MKAISIWQPWASAIAVGSKRIETRSWETSYRGSLLIHASKRCNKGEILSLKSNWTWCGVLRPLGLGMGGDVDPESVLPFGAIVAIANLVDCRRTDRFRLHEINAPQYPAGERSELYSWTEGMLGDFGLGRFGWMLDDVRRIDPVIPFRGAQGLFDVPWEAIKGAQLISGSQRVPLFPGENAGTASSTTCLTL